MQRVLLFIVIALSIFIHSEAQTCTATTYNVDLSASIDTTVSIQSRRDGDCCGGTNCVRFDLIINPACSFVNFTVASPAPPGNAAYYQVNCGPPTSLGTPICVVGQTNVTITFCKPGNDNPIYTIVAAGALQPEPDITVREGCSGTLSIGGLASGITWTSIYPGIRGAYNSYLSCVSGCASTNVTPLQGAPAYIDYEVSGFRICGPLVYDTIRVYTTPQIAVAVDPAASTICAGQLTTITASASGGDSPYNYLWSNGQTGPSITVGAGGVYTVSVTDIHNCLPAVQSATLSIAPVPVAPALTSNSPVCEGGALNLFASTIPGATYSWTGPNGFTSSLQNPVINNATIAEAGSYSVTVTVGQCTSVAATTSVVVNSIPVAPVVSSGSPVCEGTSLDLTSSLIAGATYSWTGPNGFTSSQQNPSVNNAGSLNAGNYSVTVTVNGCTSSAASMVAVVNMLPAAPIVSTNSPLCVGNTVNLVAATIPGASYSWTGPDGFNAALQNPTIANAGTNASGSYSVTATVNGCTGPAATTSITVNSIPSAPSASSNGPICAGTTLSLNATNIPGATYGWTGPNGFTSSSQNPTILNTGSPNGGAYFVTSTVNGCTSAPASVTAVVNALPLAPNVSTNSPLCTGNTVNLMAGTIAGASYSWSGPNGFNSLLQNPTIPNAGANVSGTYSVSATVNGCTGPAATALVSVSQTPPAPSVSTNGPVCAGSSLNLYASAIPGATYSWSGPNGFTSSSQNPSINNATTTNAGSYAVTVVLGQCASSSTAAITTAIVNPVPAAPVVSSNSPVCEGTSLNLGASLVSGATYNWTGPNGFTSSLQNPVVNNAGSLNNGSYSVTVTANGCTSSSVSMSAIVNLLPPAPTVSTNSPLCTGNTVNLTAGAITGASYSWTGPNGFSSSLQNPVIANAGTNVSGAYSVFATVNGCAGSAATASVTVKQTPPSPILSSNGPICLGSTLTLNASTIPGATYSWNGPGGFISSIQNPVINNTALVNSGVYNATITINGCNSPAASASVIIDQPAIVNAGNDQLVCSSDQSVNLRGSLSGRPGTGVWTTNGSGVFSSGSSNLNTSYNPSAADKSAGSVILTLTSSNNGACPVSSSSMKISFAPTPAVNAGNDQVVCANDANVLLKGQYNNASGINWSSSGNGVFSPSASDINATYIPGTKDKTDGSVSLFLKTAGSNICPAAVDTILITIKPAPTIKGGDVKYVLQHNSTVLTPEITGSNIKLLWTPGIYLNSDTLRSPLCTPDADVSYKVYSIDNFGCKASGDVVVKVLKELQIPNVFTPNGDGINEKWEVKNLKDYTDCKVEIFNRYGQVVYRSTGYTTEWDGTLNGKQLPAGTYYYIINVKIAPKPIAGFVDIVR